MGRIIVTGFTPFEKRPVNASWLVARQLQASCGPESLLASEIPVVWGEPENSLRRLIADEGSPAAIIALGEGRPGCFRLETLAINKRAAKQDNEARLPPHPRFATAAPKSLRSSAPLLAIRQGLLARNVPVLLSVDAGGYLCEETLFHLEHRYRHCTQSRSAFFVHVPPYGTPLWFKGRQRRCDEELLLEFGTDLLDVVSDQLGI